CRFSEQGPVVARYLDIGAETFAEHLQTALPGAAAAGGPLPAGDVPKAEAACREVVERIAEDVRLSLTFYRTEYDRESLPRYAVSGSPLPPYPGRGGGHPLPVGAPPRMLGAFPGVEGT